MVADPPTTTAIGGFVDDLALWPSVCPSTCLNGKLDKVFGGWTLSDPSRPAAQEPARLALSRPPP